MGGGAPSLLLGSLIEWVGSLVLAVLLGDIVVRAAVREGEWVEWG